MSGRSSGVEHNLAKVGVEGSNPFARSSFLPENELFEPREAREALVTTGKFPTVVTTLSPGSIQLGTTQACSLLIQMDNYASGSWIRPCMLECQCSDLPASAQNQPLV